MSTELSNPTTTLEWPNHKPKNPLGEHTENVDVHIVRSDMGEHWTTSVSIHAIIDDKEHGAPYEETGRELLHVTTREIEGEWSVDHWQSWFDIQSCGWSDTDDKLHHTSLEFHQMVKAIAEAGLMMVRGVR